MTGQMHEVIKEGEFYGMQSFDQHLLKHLQAGRITFEEAMHVASSPHDFKLLVQADQRLRHLAASERGRGRGAGRCRAPHAGVDAGSGPRRCPTPEPSVVADVAPPAPPRSARLRRAEPGHGTARRPAGEPSAPPPGF